MSSFGDGVGHRSVPSTTSPDSPTTQGNVMKQIILTGLATEQRFGNPSPQYFLVFNEGELRVPVEEQAAEKVVQTMYGNPEAGAVGTDLPEIGTEQDEDDLHSDQYAAESDIPQA